MTANMSNIHPNNPTNPNPTNPTPNPNPIMESSQFSTLDQNHNQPQPQSQSGNVEGKEADPIPTIPSPKTDSHPSNFAPSPYDPSYFYTNSGPIPFHPSITPATSPGVPVFQPTYKVFSNFESYCNKIDSWGMSTGIVKIIPPKQWSDNLPSLTSELAEKNNASIKGVVIRNAIVQHFTAAGSGTWRQTNITKSRLWNLKQWSDVCKDNDQRGPEMHRIKKKLEDPVHGAGAGAGAGGEGEMEVKKDAESDGVRTRSGRGRGRLPPPAPSKRKREMLEKEDLEVEKKEEGDLLPQEKKISSVTPPPSDRSDEKNHQDDEMPALEEDPQSSLDPQLREQQSRPASPTPSNSNSATPSVSSNNNNKNNLSSISPTKTTISKRKPRLKGRALVDSTTSEEWETFNHETCWLDEALHESQTDATSITPKPSDWTPAYCKEVEGEYWRGLNFGKPPMYGADLKGTLFTDETKNWNVGKLDNLLTRLKMRKQLPGVTTPYLYLGMWRATFAWHVEDMDLYSINYIHFGAPKQWYSIRQADRGRFESALQGSFPQDSTRCPHFMRHKSYLVSPSYLHNHGIDSLHLVQHAREFVITYPFGYHSGYNLGFNCAESVNFALDSWIDIGRKAGYCKCSEESVHMDVDAILEESRQIEMEERAREQERLAKEKAKLKEKNNLEKIRLQKLEKQQKMKMMNSGPTSLGEPNGKRIKLANNQHLGYQITGYPQQHAYTLPYNQAPNGYSYPYGYPPNSLPLQLPPAPKSNVKASNSASKPQEKKVSQISCCLCPSEVTEDLVKVKTKSEKCSPLFAHRLCASLIPETWVGRKGDEENPEIQNTEEEVKGYDGVAKARWNLKCGLCTDPTLSHKGAKIQCTWGSCPRAAHVSCVLGLEEMLESNKDQKEETDALREESGWFLDVLKENEADKLEGKGKFSGKASRGKGKKKPKQARSPEGTSSEVATSEPVDSGSVQNQSRVTSMVDDQGEERLVILCRGHNPLFRQLEESRKNDAIRTLALRLPVGQNIDVKYKAGYAASVLLCEVQDREGGKDGEGEGSIVVKDLNLPKGSASDAPLLDPSQVQTTTLKWRNIIWTEDQEKELIKLKDGGAEEKRLKAKKEAEERLRKRKLMQKTAEEESLEEEKMMKLRGILIRQEKAEKKRMEEMKSLNTGIGNPNPDQMQTQHFVPYLRVPPTHGYHSQVPLHQNYPHFNPHHQHQHQLHPSHPYAQHSQRFGQPPMNYAHSSSIPTTAGMPVNSQYQHSQFNYPRQSYQGVQSANAGQTQMHYQPSHPQASAPRVPASLPITSKAGMGMMYSNSSAGATSSKPNAFLPLQSPSIQASRPQPSYYSCRPGPPAMRGWQPAAKQSLNSQQARIDPTGIPQNGGPPSSVSPPKAMSPATANLSQHPSLAQPYPVQSYQSN